MTSVSTANGQSFYEVSPHFYDLTGEWTGPDRPDVRFFLDRALRVGRALEVGAGTGQIALELAARGVHVYCVEPSAAMRSTLLTKAFQWPEVHQYLTVLPAGGEDFELGRRVPLAYAARVLQHFLTDEEMLAMLRNVRRHLEADGLFLFDALGAKEPEEVPSTVIGEERVGEVLYRKTYRVRVLSPDYYKFDISYETFRGDQLLECSGASSVSRYVRRESVHRLLERAGFDVSAEFVAHGDTPFTGSEERVVIEARKRGAG